MRVLMTADTLGGIWTYAVDLSRALIDQGGEVMIAAMGRVPGSDQRAQTEKIRGLELRARPFKLEWMESPWDDVARAGDWLLELTEEFRPDVVHLNGYAHGRLPFGVPILVVAHSCVLSWWRAVKGEEAPRSWENYRQAVAAGLEAADRVIAPTAAMAGMIDSLYGCGLKTAVIANGRDPLPFRAGIKQGLILGAGRLWDEAKNLRLLERVAKHLPWPIHVAGETAPPGGNAKVTQGARALGRLSQDRMADALSAASIFAHPARYEPFGLAPLEAAISGCALVLGDIPSLREVWDEAALFVPPDDEDAWRRALNGLIEDEKMLRAFAARARDRSREYSPRAMADGYRRVYGEMREAVAAHA
jgi:glycosyltransferase involved in cell wall biosynthesis